MEDRGKKMHTGNQSRIKKIKKENRGKRERKRKKTKGWRVILVKTRNNAKVGVAQRKQN